MNPWQTKRDLAILRRDAGLFLRDTCMVKRTTETTADDGGVNETETWEFYLPCILVQDTSTADVEERGGRSPATRSQEITEAEYRLHVSYEADILPDDVIEINNERYEVRLVYTTHTDRLTKRADLVKED